MKIEGKPLHIMGAPTTDQRKPLSLRVSEGRTQDVGRALARMDPTDITGLALPIGGIVRITGTRVTFARVMPSFRETRGNEAVHLDGITRGNAGAVIGDRVGVAPAEASPALRVVLVPEGSHAARQSTGTYLARHLADLPLTAGDRVRIALFGAKFQEFRVTETVPEGPVFVRRDTELRVEAPQQESKAHGRISYEDIGGLGPAIQRIREMVELPLRYPEVFGRLGIDPPKGLLLHGPPGCGKTLLARAVASETNASFISIGGPEIITKFYGESEARLRQIFDQAKREAPAIIFLDEIDSIAPRRETVVGEVEKRVVAQLLSLMDGLESRGNVIIIGATNLPDALDPALRRPGRFDREITIGVPDSFGRKQILEIQTSGMPLADDVDVRRLAEALHGFTGADIAALCREAAMAALRRAVPQSRFDLAELPYEDLLGVQVCRADFNAALKEVEPSAMREVSVEVPDIGWDDIGGLDDVKRELRQVIEWPLAYPELFAAARLNPAKGVLLHGPPGSGKTLLAKAVARQAGVNFISVKGPELLSKYVGESEREIRNIFRKARQASPCVIFFDEFDALAPKRSSGGGDSRVSERVVGQILTEIDGVVELEGILVLAATNRLDMIDPAVLRPGRFDRVIAISDPGPADRLSILKVHLRGRPVGPDVAAERIAELCQGMSGAGIAHLCREAAFSAVREHLNKPDRSEPTFQICLRHFAEALDRANGRSPKA